jgi:hypothetical protein
MEEGMEPSFEHLRNTTLLAKLYSFRLARGNGWDTMKIEFQNLSNLVVFVFYPGNFTGLPAMPETERLATQKWLKDVIARARREAHPSEQHPRPLCAQEEQEEVPPLPSPTACSPVTGACLFPVPCIFQCAMS